MRKGIYYSTLIGDTPEEKFACAAKYGFKCVEIPTLNTPEERSRFRSAAEDNGISIPSVMNQAHWSCPLSDPDAAVRAKSAEGMMNSLETALATGADTVLLVPAVVTPFVTYERAWEVSQLEIDKFLPDYEDAQVCIGIENVGNKFLLSPLEFCQYIDEFDSRWVRAYFDVGNYVRHAYPEHWIATLGARIKKVHIKGYDVKSQSFCSLLDGTIDWKAVMCSLRCAGYDDVLTAELAGKGDTPDERLTNISSDMDTIMEMI